MTAEEIEQRKIAEAVAEGYPDEDATCTKCGVVFKNYHHYIRCDERPCPMSCGKTLFELWAELGRIELWTENLGSE